MARQQKPRRMGRPSLPPGEKKLPSVGFRPTPDLKAWLERTARDNGRSVSKEIESRLEQSILAEDANYDAFGTEEAFKVMRLMSMWATAVLGRKWPQDYGSCSTALGAMDSLLRHRFGLEPIDTSAAKLLLETKEINPFGYEDLDRDIGRYLSDAKIEKATSKKV